MQLNPQIISAAQIKIDLYEFVIVQHLLCILYYVRFNLLYSALYRRADFYAKRLSDRNAST